MTATALMDASSRLKHVPGVRTRNVEEAVALMSERYRSHRLRLRENRALDFLHHAVPFEEASLNLLRYGPDLVVDAGAFESFYMLEVPLSGGVDIAYGAERVSSGPERGLFLSPGPSVLSNWRSGTTQVMLRIDRAFVERAYARATGGPNWRTPVFAPEIDLASAAGRRIAALLGLLVAEQMEHRDAQEPPAAAPLINAILETIFAHADCRAVNERLVAPGSVAPYYVKRFRELLADPARLPLSIAELADAVGVTPRTLAGGMRRFMGLSPHEYLRRRRMERAATLLKQGAMPVAQVAAAVGYANAGRFAAAFKRYSGLYPSAYARWDG